MLTIIGALTIIIARFVNALQDAVNIEIGTDNVLWHLWKTIFLSLWAIGFALMGYSWNTYSIYALAITLVIQWRLFEFALPIARDHYRKEMENLDARQKTT